MISERCKAAAVISKRQGKKFGIARRSKTWQRRVSALGRAALTKLAAERAAAYRVHIEWALGQPGLHGRPISRKAAARKLNERNIKSSTGRTWSGEQLLRMAHRIGLKPPPARLPLAVSQAKVQDIWKQYPHYDAKQIIKSGKLPLPLCERTVRELLNNCRRSPANPQGRLNKSARLLLIARADGQRPIRH